MEQDVFTGFAGVGKAFVIDLEGQILKLPNTEYGPIRIVMKPEDFRALDASIQEALDE